MWRRAFLLAALGLAAPVQAAWAQITVEGVIYDSETFAPVSGVALFVVDAQTDDVLAPQAFAQGEEQGQITGADGRYNFTVTSTEVVRLTLERLDANFSYPSVAIPPEGGGSFGRVACDTVPCPNGRLAVANTPTNDAPYALLFNTSSSRFARNNHIPVDRLDRLLNLKLQADRNRLTPGGRMAFTITATQTSGAPLANVNLQVALPAELRVSPTTVSARILAADGTERALEIVGGRITLGLWAPGEVLRVAGIAAVGRTNKRRLSMRSWLERGAGIRVSNQAAAEFTLGADRTLGQSTILGQVYCESNEGRAGWVDSTEQGVPGARVVLDTGFEARADAQGRFHFTGVPPGTRLLKVDERSLPAGSVVGSPRRQLYLSPGTPHRVRFAVQCEFEQWQADSVFAGEQTSPGPVQPRTLPLALAADGHSFTLGPRRFEFMRAELHVARERGILRMFPSVLAGAAPERWRLRVQRVTANAKPLEIKDTRLVGRGLPPVFVELPVDAKSAYRVRLIAESGELDSVSTPWRNAPVLAQATLPSRMLGTFAAEPGSTMASRAAAVLPDVRAALAFKRAVIRVEGHWDGADGAEQAVEQGRQLAESVVQHWVRAGLDRASFEVVSRGAESPRVPSLSRRLRIQNRRVDIVAASRTVRPQMPWVETASAAALWISADNRQAELPRTEGEGLNVSLELDPPARVELRISDGEGGFSRMQRVVTVGRVIRPGDRQALAVARQSNEVRVADVAYAWPTLGVGGAVRTGIGGWSLSLDIRGPERADHWRAVWVGPAGEVLAHTLGSGEPPPRLELVTTSSQAALGGLVHFELGLDTRRRLRARTLRVPALAAPTGVLRVRPSDGDVLTPLQLFLSSAEPGLKVVRLHGGGSRRREFKRTLEQRGVLVEAGRERGALELEAFRRQDAPLAPRIAATTTATAARGNAVLRLHNADNTLSLALPVFEQAPLEREPPPPKPAIDQVLAGRVRIQAPKNEGFTEADRFVAVGQADPADRIQVNGRAVPVTADGRFLVDVPLEPGANSIEIEVRDPEGGRALIQRQVSTATSSWFVLALAEGRMSTGGAELAGSGPTTFREVGPLGLHGRVAVVAEGRTAWAGRRLSLSGRLDTAEFDALTQVRRLEDDPLRLMPALGDAATETQLTASRRGVDVTLRLDESAIEAGNRAHSYSLFDGDGLFEARLAGFGAFADVNESVTEHDDTRLRGGATFANGGVLRERDELLATGGALYWLSRRDLVEGSERVRLVVRDRDTGFTLQEDLLVRGRDYRIRPHEGRMVMSRPIASHSGVLAGKHPSVAGNAGHPVFIVVDYSFFGSGSQSSYVAALSETLFEQLELHFGVAGTEGQGESHRLLGAGAAWRPTESSFVEFEWARSQGRTTLGRLSTDGGLGFVELSEPALLGEQDAAQAFGLRVNVDLEDVLGTRGFVRLNGRSSDNGFASVSSARAAGRLEGEVAVGVALSSRWFVKARAAAARTDTRTIGTDLFRTTQALLSASADYRSDDWGAGADVVHHRSTAANLDGNATAFVLRYERSLTEDLTLRGAQQLAFGTALPSASGAGRFATSVGLAWAFHDRLTADLWQTVRYNGDNSSQVGLRYTDPEGMSVYVAERMGQTAGSTQLTTVVGAEESVGGSRSYGELQFGGGLNPADARAVLGMEHRFEVTQDLRFTLAYERVQLTSGQPVTTDPGPWAGALGGLSSTLGGFGSAVRLLPEAVSRDALSMGVGYRPRSALRFDLRGELRLDHAPTLGSDYLSAGVVAGGAWVMTEGLSLTGRLDVHHVQDKLAGELFARSIEGSMAAVYRPVTEDWLTVVVRYTKWLTQRPRALEQAGVSENRDALSVEPIIDTPYGVRLLERVALVKTNVKLEGLEDDELSILWINRLEAELPWRLDLGVEYRMLAALESETVDRGFLAELGWLPQDNVRLGVGYNFSSFSDDLQVLASENAAGPFLRVTARY